MEPGCRLPLFYRYELGRPGRSRDRFWVGSNMLLTYLRRTNTGVLVSLAVLCAVFLPAIPATAHHSFSAEFDSNKPVALTGVVTKVEWMNPHARFYVDVKGADGKVVNWDLETGSPNGLLRRGWNQTVFEGGRRGHSPGLSRQRRLEHGCCPYGHTSMMSLS
jgi:hypothetical protein